MTTREHWDRIYQTRTDPELSWYEEYPAVSLHMLDAVLTPDSCVIDIGGGNARFVDALLARGLRCLFVLDLARAALDLARLRTAGVGDAVTWIEADVCGDWSVPPMDVWHDRAVFHFLTEPDQRTAYRRHLTSTVKAGGTALIATFSLEGPQKCSGLPVVRYSPESLAAELGHEFALADSQVWQHATPWGATQSFQYSRFTRR